MHIQDKIKLLNRTLYKNPKALCFESFSLWAGEHRSLQNKLHQTPSSSETCSKLGTTECALLGCGDGYCLFQKIKWSCGGLMALESHQEGSSSAWGNAFCSPKIMASIFSLEQAWITELRLRSAWNRNFKQVLESPIHSFPLLIHKFEL